MPDTTKPTLVDSHCHIDLPQFDADRADVIARAHAAGVRTMLLIGECDGEDGLGRALSVGEEWGLPVAGGIHPHDARTATDAIFDDLRERARASRLVAIGEIGLDFHYDLSPREIQVEVFRKQVRLARDVGLPVIVHTREADEMTASLLEQEGAAEIGGVIHCFTGGDELADRALALGFSISFSGIVTFPRSQEIQAIARRVPQERLLVETDAPFLAPPPYRGKRNEPAFVVEVARRVAELRGETLEQLGRVVDQNFRARFRV